MTKTLILAEAKNIVADALRLGLIRPPLPHQNNHHNRIMRYKYTGPKKREGQP